MTGHPDHPPHIIPKERIGNLIDAIYAFSMTLLVITISVPPKYLHTEIAEPVQDILTNVLPDILHYFIAFIILALFWYFEHQRFHHLQHLDRPLLVMNIASLAFVCLIPFTTNVAGDFPYDMFGAILFELNIFVIGMIAFVQWIYIMSRGTYLTPRLEPHWIRRELQWALVFPALALIGIILAVLRQPATSAIFLLAPFIMAVLFWKDPVKAASSKDQ
ncbi:MAG: TMEM175 family protein [Methanoregula sp.]|uniref:TMEM175 family protein n=1 Tax=Methanoregula sp. TaxID=2052170 RepID=UPI0025F029E5|nr:TMEM175 family protein [Methanoregula sp.]MCK9632599.1 TMEM175 family protein [Methanoregula sp.]